MYAKSVYSTRVQICAVLMDNHSDGRLTELRIPYNKLGLEVILPVVTHVENN